MRELDVKEITEAIAGLSKETNVSLSEDVKSRTCMMRMKETDEGAKSILETIEKNIKIAGEEGRLRTDPEDIRRDSRK